MEKAEATSCKLKIWCLVGSQRNWCVDVFGDVEFGLTWFGSGSIDLIRLAWSGLDLCWSVLLDWIALLQVPSFISLMIILSVSAMLSGLSVNCYLD